MRARGHRICEVLPGSIGEELGLEPGDTILAVNGEPIEDIFDYDYLCQDVSLHLLVKSRQGEEVMLDIEKEEDEDLGIRFENGLMDEYHSCRNRCVFCFIDQMPPGMRETLYFKDDDTRLSFLQGNYITLTNLNDHDIERIIHYHLSPINISVHTTDPELRCRMLNNRFAGRSLEFLQRLADAGTPMNGQIVLCPGWNDGEALRRTISDLVKLIPSMQSVSVVPVGLTRFRDGLPELTPVSREKADETIRIVGEFQKRIYPKYGTHFVHASDEFYVLAGRPVPEDEQYDGYPQYENGVGFIRLMDTEFRRALSGRSGDCRVRRITAATGTMYAPYLNELADALRQRYPNIEIHIIPISNHFFGEQITVAGLITGTDLREQLSGTDLGEELLLPQNMLRSGENVFLDDVTTDELEQDLGVKIRITGGSGEDLLAAFLGEADDMEDYPPYEPEGWEWKEQDT